MHTRNTARFATFMTLAFAVGVAACDNPVQPEEHPEAGGVVILNASTGAVLTQSIGANVAFTLPLTLTVGVPLEVEILFLDDSDPTNLDLAFHPDAAEGESLRVVITNEAIVEYNDFGDHGDFEGVAAGETTARVQLRHGDHPDFETGFLTITVQ